MPTFAPQTRDLKAKLFRGLADPSRLAVLESLRDGPRSVTAIAEATGLSQPNTSNHLRCLHDCGLVSRDQRGRSVHYGLRDERVEALLALADVVIADVARGMYACARYAAPAEETL